MLLLLVFLVALFSSLGVWQLQRLAWKEALIATVDERISAEPVAVPPSEEWDSLDVDERVYQRVWLTGRFDHSKEVQSLAVSELGSGYWVMTPLQLDEGGVVLVNRGFVPQAMREPADRASAGPTGSVRVTGLLRASEPEGGFLRDNDPDNGRWYSRDVDAIADVRQFPAPVAPFFVDADAGTGSNSLPKNASNASGSAEERAEHDFTASPDFPRGGMTVVTFRNSHRVYALTWFALALLSVVGIGLLIREWRRDKRTPL